MARTNPQAQHARPDPTRDLSTALSAGNLTAAVDAAVEVGAAGRDRLPENLRPAFSAVRSAWDAYVNGHDDSARAHLDSIGLGSPFLEWKLLLRGLIAYSTNDDARALENWSRLKPGRIPARIVSPLRAMIDPAYAASQKPDAQVRLRSAADTLVGGTLLRLRELEKSFGRGTRVAGAFRNAEVVVRGLRSSAPHLVPRLANVYLNAIIHDGEPDDFLSYTKHFGTPADDPTLGRAMALGQEERGFFSDANLTWKSFADDLAKNPAWPAEDRKRAQALVWCRMGANAVRAEAEPSPSPYSQPVDPSAAACFRKSIQLAPDLLIAHVGLVNVHHAKGDLKRARAAGEGILKHYPEHVNTLKLMAEMCHELDDLEAALGYAKRAVAINPLDRSLRGLLANCYRQQARGGDAEAARAALDAAAEMADGAASVPLLAQRWALEAKAKNLAAANAARDRAYAAAPHRAAVALAFVGEGARQKVPKPIKKPFDDELAATLKSPEPAAIAALLAGWDEQDAAGGYYGSKTHFQKTLTGAKAAAKGGTEADVVALTAALAAGLHWKALRDAAAVGVKRFPKNVWLILRELQGYVEDQTCRVPWTIQQQFARVRQMPKDAAAEAMLDDLKAKYDQAFGFGGFGSFFNNFFGGPPDPERDEW